VDLYCLNMENVPSTTPASSHEVPTPVLFELKLLEAAVKGKETFLKLTKEEKTDKNKEKLWLEILHEIETCEKNGPKVLQERGRRLVVRWKDVEELHQRALIVYRDFLDLNHSHTTRGSFRVAVDEKFEDIKIVDLPTVSESWLSEEFVPGKLIGEPTEDPLSIFKEPEEGEGVTAGAPETCSPGETEIEKINIPKISTASSAFTRSPGASSIAYQDSSFTEGMCADDEKIRDSLVEYEGYFKNDSKASSSDGAVPRKSLLGSFPWRDFKDPVEWKIQNPIEWKIDSKPYSAKNIADLKENHKVLVEGAFRKRCRTHKWRTYYGFLISTGVLLYFRKEVYKKFVDIRNSTISQPRSKQFRLFIDRVAVDSKEINWLMEFDKKYHLCTWKEQMILLSKGLKIDIISAV